MEKKEEKKIVLYRIKVWPGIGAPAGPSLRGGREAQEGDRPFPPGSRSEASSCRRGAGGAGGQHEPAAALPGERCPHDPAVLLALPPREHVAVQQPAGGQQPLQPADGQPAQAPPRPPGGLGREAGPRAGRRLPPRSHHSGKPSSRDAGCSSCPRVTRRICCNCIVRAEALCFATSVRGNFLVR